MWKLIKHSIAVTTILVQLVIIIVLLWSNDTGNMIYTHLVSSVECSDQIYKLSDELYRCKKTLYDLDNLRGRLETYKNCLQCIQDSFNLIEEKKVCEENYDELSNQLLLKETKDNKCIENLSICQYNLNYCKKDNKTK